MLKIEKWVSVSPEQMEIIIEGMRNPMNSWDKADSAIEYIADPETLQTAGFEFHLGEADETLMRGLAHGGPVNAKYRRMMPVWVMIEAPLYWWKEFDTYKIGTTSNSCSTMHKIHAKEFTIDDFSHEHLIDNMKFGNFESFDLAGMLLKFNGMTWLHFTIRLLNYYRKRYLKTHNKLYWWQMIQMLPSSYNQKRLVYLPYEALINMDFWRENHKLDEWHTLCDWIKSLPYYNVVTNKEN